MPPALHYFAETTRTEALLQLDLDRLYQLHARVLEDFVHMRRQQPPPLLLPLLLGTLFIPVLTSAFPLLSLAPRIRPRPLLLTQKRVNRFLVQQR
jgi:hypothetical protein